MTSSRLSLQTLGRDLPAGIVVFLVALPLCLGIALASDAPLFSGIVSGIVGGIVVGWLSGSQTSVAGPAAGLTAIVATQIATLGSFRAFLLATTLAGLMQVGMGIARAGFIGAFFPSSVVKGLLAAIGVILMLKQIPHMLGHDPDPFGEMEFAQPDERNTFSALFNTLFDLHPGAALIGILSAVLLLGWSRSRWLVKSRIPAPLAVVVLAVLFNELFVRSGTALGIEPTHLVQVPVTETLQDFGNLLAFPDWSQWQNPAVYTGAVTIALVASLETLLNLEAVDKIDPEQRHSPPNRELIAQGAGNVVAGLIGGLPMTSVIVRSSVNVLSKNKTKFSAIFHGVLLLACVAFVPFVLNRIPLSCLAAILVTTGLKLASPQLVRQMWAEGRPQFIPFATTVAAIVLTDLLIGIGIGLLVSVGFILRSNLRRPLRKIVEKHATGDIIRLELANQVSFLNRAALKQLLEGVPRGGHLLLDARQTDYIDPDVLDLLTDFKTTTAPAHEVNVSLVGFRDRYPDLEDRIQFVDYTSRDLQTEMTPAQVLQVLKEGNERFRTGQRLTRDLVRQVNATSDGQAPLAVVLSCIDSRTPAELVFDLGIGDVFSVRIAGNVARQKVLGSIEYACKIAGARLVLVLGHTSCGAVTSAVDLIGRGKTAAEATGCDHVDALIDEISTSINVRTAQRLQGADKTECHEYIDKVAQRNVLATLRKIREESRCIDTLVSDGKVALVGGMYDVRSGAVHFLVSDSEGDARVPDNAMSQGHVDTLSRPCNEPPAPPTGV